MPFDTPFALGPFLVDSEGRLSRASDDAEPSFSFRWRGRLLRAAMAPNGTMTLRAVLGRVPSTASEQAVVRRQSFELLRAFSAATPEGWRVGLLPDHRAMLEASMPMPEPLTATRLLTGITDFVLRLEPYLDLVDESGMPARGVAGRFR